MLNHYNSNGLEKGKIPSYTECPFWSECGRRIERCPSQDNENLEKFPKGFSCGAARLQSSIKLTENRPHLLATGKSDR
jgi:hypothetical protein